MRYLAGTIAISGEADLPILQTVYRAGHLTAAHLYEFLHPPGVTRNVRDSFRWRLRRLVQQGFLERINVNGLGNVLSLGAQGELFLQGKEPNIVERASRSSTPNGRNQVWHDAELFGIQVALRRAGVVNSWQYETEIRAANDFTTFGYAKDYDAVVTFSVGGVCATVGLEYERTAKSSREYERICVTLNRETRLEMFLYLVPNPQLRSFLAHAMRVTTRVVHLAVAPDFCGDPLQTELVDARSGNSRRLRECLSVAG